MLLLKLENLNRITIKKKKSKNDTSLIWKGIRQFVMLKNKSKRQPSIITVNGKDVTNHKNIANAFNILITNIGTSLSKTIPHYIRLYLNQLPMMRYENLYLS